MIVGTLKQTFRMKQGEMRDVSIVETPATLVEKQGIDYISYQDQEQQKHSIYRIESDRIQHIRYTTPVMKHVFILNEITNWKNQGLNFEVQTTLLDHHKNAEGTRTQIKYKVYNGNQLVNDVNVELQFVQEIG